MKLEQVVNRIKPFIKVSLKHSKDAVIVGCLIIIFISRVLSDSEENEVTVSLTRPTEEIIITEVQTESISESISESLSKTEAETFTEQITTSESIQSTVKSNNETKLAYSPELNKTFTISEFSKLTKDELMTFSGIGEVTAQRILDYIAENGPFQNFEEIMEVKGIGEKKLQKLLTIFP